MKSSLLRTLASVALLLACIETMAAPVDLSTAAFRDAQHARVERSERNGQPVADIIPAVPDGATFTYLYSSDPTDGFNSTATPAAGAGCNDGETLGACRKRTLEFVAAYWGSLLQSNVPIVANVSMPQVIADCSNRPPYYGAAGPTYMTANVPNAPSPDILYPAALANALAGFDLSPSSYDIVVLLNEGADHGCEGGWAGWWYGTDAGVAIPENRISMFAVMLHEFGHGLGFMSGYDAATGQSPVAGQTPIWGYYLYDAGTGKSWKDMTDAERAASAKNDPNLVWAGANTSRWVAKFLSPVIDLVVNAPGASAGTYVTAVSNSGVPLRSALTSDAVAVIDGTGDPRDGCETPFANAAALAGKIAVMDAYNCPIGRKILNAQSQGAVAVLVSNYTSPGPAAMYATGADADIPAYGIEQSIGGAMLTSSSAFNVTLQPRTGTDAYGAKDGCARIHAPATLQPGSSASHFSGDGLPTMLLQPSAPIALYQAGLALNLLQDIGWKIRAEDGLFADGFDGSPCAYAHP